MSSSGESENVLRFPKLAWNLGEHGVFPVPHSRLEYLRILKRVLSPGVLSEVMYGILDPDHCESLNESTRKLVLMYNSFTD